MTLRGDLVTASVEMPSDDVGRVQRRQLTVQIVDTERHEEKTFAVLGEISSGNRIGLVGTDEHEPGVAHPGFRDIRPAWRMVEEAERLDVEDTLEALHRAVEVADDEVKVVYAIGRH